LQVDSWEGKPTGYLARSKKRTCGLCAAGSLTDHKRQISREGFIKRIKLWEEKKKKKEPVFGSSEMTKIFS
jgi:hypothetical protein